MSIIEIEKVEKKQDNEEPRFWHLVDYETRPDASRALCGAKLRGVDGGDTYGPDGDTCVVCADLAWGTYGE